MANVESLSSYYFIENQIDGIGTGKMHPIIDAFEDSDESFRIIADYSQSYDIDIAVSIASIYFELGEPTFVDLAKEKGKPTQRQNSSS